MDWFLDWYLINFDYTWRCPQNPKGHVPSQLVFVPMPLDISCRMARPEFTEATAIWQTEPILFSGFMWLSFHFYPFLWVKVIPTVSGSHHGSCIVGSPNHNTMVLAFYGAAQVTDEPMWFSHGTRRPKTVCKPGWRGQWPQLKWLEMDGVLWMITNFHGFQWISGNHHLENPPNNTWCLIDIIYDYINGDRTTLTSTVCWYWLFFLVIMFLVNPAWSQHDEEYYCRTHGFHSMQIDVCTKTWADTCRYRQQALSVLLLTLTLRPCSEALAYRMTINPELSGLPCLCGSIWLNVVLNSVLNLLVISSAWAHFRSTSKQKPVRRYFMHDVLELWIISCLLHCKQCMVYT